MPATNLAPAADTAPASTSATDPLIHFPEGLVGCENWQRFVLLVDEDEDLPVALMQCVDEPAVTLMVTDPRLLIPEYAAALNAQDRQALALTPDAAPVLYCTVSVANDGRLTANLLGPLAINAAARRGRQLVLTESTYSAQHPIAVPAASGPHE